jgi:hypothetical protein
MHLLVACHCCGVSCQCLWMTSSKGVDMMQCMVGSCGDCYSCDCCTRYPIPPAHGCCTVASDSTVLLSCCGLALVSFMWQVSLEEQGGGTSVWVWWGHGTGGLGVGWARRDGRHFALELLQDTLC